MPPVDWTISEGPILYLIGAAILVFLGSLISKSKDKAQQEALEKRIQRPIDELAWLNWPDQKTLLLSNKALEDLRHLHEVQQKIISSGAKSKLLKLEDKLIQDFISDYPHSYCEPVIVATDDEELLKEQTEFVVLTDEIAKCKAKIFLELDLIDSGFPLREVMFTSEEMTSLGVAYEPQLRKKQLNEISHYLWKLEVFVANYDGNNQRITIF